jgi:hypothetical protein
LHSNGCRAPIASLERTYQQDFDIVSKKVKYRGLAPRV